MFLEKIMQMKIQYILGAFLIILFTQCEKETAEVTTQESTSLTQRPYNPYVFRSVLDNEPRMLTFALHDDLWVTYSAETGRFHKAWKGVVTLQGAVYNTQHGPQPISLGDAYFVNSVKTPWSINGKDAKSTFEGHIFNDDIGALKYSITDGNKTIQIEETPDVVEDENGFVTFTRIFKISGADAEDKIQLRTNFNSLLLESSVQSDGEITFSNIKEKTKEKYTAIVMDGLLTLKNNESTSLNTKLMKTPFVVNVNNKKEEKDDRPEGLKLIAKSDCKSCHNTYQKTVGPAYNAIAARYDNNESTINMLTNKVIAGGGGVWGQAAMTAHKNVPREDITKMVQFIMDLDKEEEAERKKNEAAGIENTKTLAADSTSNIDKKVFPGINLKVTQQRKNIKGLDDIKWSKKPSFEGIIPQIQMYDADLSFVSDWFGLEMDGYIKVEKEDNYTLRLVSDDGSRLYLDNELLINNDGFHGAEARDAEVILKKGLHPFKVQYFNGTGGKNVVLKWSSFSDSEFKTIPADAFFYHKDNQKLIGGIAQAPIADNRKIPGDKMVLNDVHPSFDLLQARPNNFLPKVGGMDFLPNGDMVVSVWDPSGSVYRIENAASGDPSQMKAILIANGLAEPLGLKVVDGDIYVMQKQELTRLIDHNKDGKIDEYQTVSNDWDVSGNFHEFGFGLVYKEGYFYAALAIAIDPGGASTQPQIQDRGKCIKIAKDGSSVEFVASGLRTPNGVGIGVDDEVFIADNQGDWLPANKIVHIQKGAFYGNRSVDFKGTANKKVKLPVVWLPQDEIGNSPSQMIPLKVGPYKGQMAHGEVTHGGLKRVFVEKVNGEYQGCVFRFTQGLEAGVNRVCLDPKGNIFIGGIGNPGNWGQTGKLWYGLQQLKYNNTVTFEMLAVRAHANGIEIEFTEPIESSAVIDENSFDVQHWYYKPTKDYGGPKLGKANLKIKDIKISDDRKKIFLETNQLKPNHVVYIRLLDHFVSENENPIWTTEAWYTMNQIPNTKSQLTQKVNNPAPNSLTEMEKEKGWKLLFNGKNLENWHLYGKADESKSWKVNNGTIRLDTKRKAEDNWQVEGDLVTDEEFENFELKLQWKISNCGNSGIMFLIDEQDKFEYPWMTGLEMQVLDNTCHPDAVIPAHQAGDLYDLQSCEPVTVRPAGQWNDVIIKLKNGKLEQWLNGHPVVKTELWTEEWKKRLANSKWKDFPAFSVAKKGKIGLQDHGDEVSYRNIKIRKI